MRRVRLEDITGPARYGEIRDDFRKRVIALKRDRRIAIGDRVSLVFENFDTVLFQIQEMLHAERINDLDRVRAEVDVYNELLPGDGELSATMLIELTDQTRAADELKRLIGIDEHVSLLIGDETSGARFEPGRSTAEKLSAVQYLRFQLSEAAVQAFRASAAPVTIRIDHPNYEAATTLTPGQRSSLAGDLGPS